MKLGILGAGMIVKDFLSFASELPEINLEAISARNLEKLKALQEEYKFKNIYTDMDELLRDENVDTVYVAVPNIMHYNAVRKSLEAGKNVICEKPFTLDYNEAAELFDLAESKKLILIEAITNQYQENYKIIKNNLSKIGEVRLVECNYSQLSSRYENFKKGILAPVFDKKQGGGVLGDLNIYNIHFAVGLFGAPKAQTYFSNIVRDVDTSGILVLEYESFKVVCIAAKDTFNNSYVNIQGDEGLIKVVGPTNEVPNYTIQTKELLEEGNNNIHEHRMFAEFKKFIEVIDNKDFDFMNLQKEHSLAVMKVLDEARKTME